MNVRAEMARRGVSQTALGAAIGLSQTALYRRLASKTSFTVDQIIAIAKHLDVEVGDLIDSSDDSPADSPALATGDPHDQKAAS